MQEASKAAWEELIQVYTDVMESQDMFAFKVTPSQAEQIFAALKKLQQTSGMNNKKNTHELSANFAQTWGGLPSNQTKNSSDLYVALKRRVPDELEDVFERTIYHASKNPTAVVHEKPSLTDQLIALAEKKHIESVEVKTVQESQPGLMGRMFNAAVSWLKPARVVETPELSPEIKPEIPTYAQQEDAWRRLIKTYEVLVNYSREMDASPIERKVVVSFDIEKVKTILTSELGNFQKMVSHENTDGLNKLIDKFSSNLGLPKGDYGQVFVQLRGCLSHGELRELFVETFEPAALAWKNQEQREARVVDAWQHLMSVYKVVVENVENSGNIKLLCIELRNFQKLAATLGAEKLETKIAELTEKFGSPTMLSSAKKEALLIKVGGEPGGDKLLGLLESMLRSPLDAPRNAKPSADQAHTSHK